MQDSSEILLDASLKETYKGSGGGNGKLFLLVNRTWYKLKRGGASILSALSIDNTIKQYKNLL